MSESKASIVEIRVRLIGPDGHADDHHLPDGATLADLLRQAGTDLSNQSVWVDGIKAEEGLSLHDGAIVTIVPSPGDPDRDQPWRAIVPAFQDDALFQEYTEALKARRQAVYPEEGPPA